MARNKEVIIDTRLGQRSIDMDKVVRFPRGLAGFETERDFILLQIRPEAPLLILQSVHTPQVGLLVADPYSFLDHSYAQVLGPAERQLLQLADPAEAVLLVTVSIPVGVPEQAALNLTGPIFINHKVRLGVQAPQSVEGPQQINMHTLKPVAPADPADPVAPAEPAAPPEAPAE